MQKTIFSILWAKFLETLERATWEDLFLTSAKLFSWSIISLFLVNIPSASEKLAMAIKWHDFAICKILGAFIVVFSHKLIISAVKSVYFWILDNIPELPKTPVHGPQYFGIPVIELVDYIFSASSYSRTEFCEYFGVSRKVFDDLASGLDKIEVFVRGANNARVLSPNYSRADISSILTRASENGEIRPLIRSTGNGYTHTPSMPEIVARSPSPHFVTRPISSFRVSA